jgi:hypothetical protein
VKAIVSNGLLCQRRGVENVYANQFQMHSLSLKGGGKDRLGVAGCEPQHVLQAHCQTVSR